MISWHMFMFKQKVTDAFMVNHGKKCHLNPAMFDAAACVNLKNKQKNKQCTSTLNFAPFTLAWHDKRSFADSVRDMTHHCHALSWKKSSITQTLVTNNRGLD